MQLMLVSVIVVLCKETPIFFVLVCVCVCKQRKRGYKFEREQEVYTGEVGGREKKEGNDVIILQF